MNIMNLSIYLLRHTIISLINQVESRFCMMKAMVLTKPGVENISLIKRPVPVPRRQEILMKMKAVSLNYRDVEIARGTYHTHFQLPLIPLSDGVGEVVAVGEEVTRFTAGDRVCSTFWQRWVGGSFRIAETGYQRGGPIDGMLAEYVIMDEQAAVLAPDSLSDEEAATLPCAAVTAWNALVTQGNIKAGDTVLLQGTGGVSLFALQFAKVSGARIIITSSSDEKLKKARALGAFAGINYKHHPDWAKEVLELTSGYGVDHILDVGGPQSFAQSLHASARGAQINVIGYLGGTEGQINPLDIFRRQVVVRGIPVGSRETFESMNRAIEHHYIKPVIDKIFPWTDISKALAYMENASHFGKVVLHYHS